MHRLKTAAIAREVGFSEGSLFKHFANKAEIIDAAIEHLDHLLFPVEPEAPLEPPVDALDALKRFLRHRVRVLGERPELLKLLLSSALDKAASESAVLKVVALRHRSLAQIKRLIEAALDEDLIRAGTSPTLLITLVHGFILTRVFSASSADQPPKPFEALWSEFEALIRK